MHTIHKILLVLLVVLVISHGVAAFGAGNIPSFAYMEGRAFRHGDIEDILESLLKKSSGGLGSIIGKGGSKFGGLDIKRVYFGNWLRDYSQAVDIMALKKMPLQTILNLCMALGFLAHGYATAEFEVTEERLGVYLPVEHIDNPRGYGEGEDPRKSHPKLRGPVDPRELDVDLSTGMKNYIANESGGWDTSKALVRRLLEKCVHTGRQARAQGRKEDEYEAFRLLGTLLHTLEDFPAHSNFCELALVSMGHRDVFLHVGDSSRIQAPGGKTVAPLVTGTFGGSDFIHSLLGEATDHISSASVSDLNKALSSATVRSRGGPGEPGQQPADVLRDLLFKLPGSEGGQMARDMDSIEQIRAGPAAGGKNPEQMSPQELHAVLWQVLTFRDKVVKSISATIEKIPGLGPLIEKLLESISVFVFTTLEPYLKPLLKSASTGLMSASGEVIDSHDQYEVFNDPRASDPTHSFLSKDHFNLILNEPAGQLAKIIVTHTVMDVVKAWDDSSVNVHHMSEEILQCLFHPDFHNQQSKVQREMLQYMRDWVKAMGNNQHKILSRLGKTQVRNHENIRGAGEGGESAAVGSAAYNAGLNAQHDVQNYVNNAFGAIPGVSQAQGFFNNFSAPPGGGPPGGVHGGRREMPGADRDAAPGYPGAATSSHGPPPPVMGDPSGYSQPSYPSYQQQQQPMGSPYYGGGGGPPPPPSFPGGPGGPPVHSGYNPGYGGGYDAGPPSFPGSGGFGMPGANSGGYGGGPGGPGGFGPPAPSPYGAPGYPNPQGQAPGGFPSPFGGPPQGAPNFPDQGYDPDQRYRQY